MRRLPSRFRRLDGILADLPIDDPMLLGELDGYLTAIALCPVATSPDEWLPPIWGGSYGEAAPFDDPIDVQLFAEMVRARHDEIVREIARGKFQPIFDVDERNGEIVWEDWIDGFAQAMALRPDAWATPVDADGDADADADAVDPGAGAAAALAYLRLLIDLVDDATDLTSVEINALHDAVATTLPAHVAQLFAWRERQAAAPPVAAIVPAKPGRNDRCPCGSGDKYKRCCGA